MQTKTFKTKTYSDKFCSHCYLIKSAVNYLNETVEGSICLISKTSLIYKQKTNILPNIFQLMLDFINCHENA